MVKTTKHVNFLVITIMVAMIGFTGLFIYSHIKLKDKIIYKIVQQTELITSLLTKMSIDQLNRNHQEDVYSNILTYGMIIGVNDIGIYNVKGEEAFRDTLPPSAAKQKAAAFSPLEMEKFRKTVENQNKTDYFDHDRMTYTGFVPLKNEEGCVKCHKNPGEILGVLAIKLSTKDDFGLLDSVQYFIWGLGFIVCIPVVGLFLAWRILQQRNALYQELEFSNENLKRTFTSLEETKYYLQLILDNSKAIIITTDKNSKIVEFNKEAQNLLEYSKEEVVGKDILMIYVNPGQRLDIIKNREVLEQDFWVAKNREVELKSKSGKPVHINLTLSALMNEKGQIIGTVGVGKDISEQKMLRFKLLQSEKLAGIGILASGIAHEINNPLSGILGMAEAIRDEHDAELGRSYAKDIIKYALDASNIVKELSSYSRHARDESKSTVDLSAIIEYSLKMARHSVSLLSIDVVSDLQSTCHIFANEGEIRQVFVNLMVNAIHAMKEHGMLTLKCRKEGELVICSVGDTGCGISKENLNYIFDPFFTTKPVGQGTGLGLYVVYRIITKYDGTIDIDSTVGVGTTVTLKFPAIKTATSAGHA